MKMKQTFSFHNPPSLLLLFTFCLFTCFRWNFSLAQEKAKLGGVGLLYPIESSSRELKDLSGVWNFRTSPSNDQDIGFRHQWYANPLSQTGYTIPMPVPSSYNDITQDVSIRDFVGWVWYDFEFFVNGNFVNDSQRAVLYFGSAQYTAIVWLNGINVMNHSIGHLPFQAEVSNNLKLGSLNRITVALNNTLTPNTIPQGFVQYHNDTSRYPPGFFAMSHPFDFMNYAGIHRKVVLYTTPKTYIDDLTIVTDIEEDETTGVIRYDLQYVTTNGNVDKQPPLCYVEIYDKNGTLVGQNKGLTGDVIIENAKLWWPYLMNPLPAYLYVAKFRLLTEDRGEDVYYQSVGIRTIHWTNTSFLINGKPFYFRGFGKHEDYDIRGRGMDLPLVIKDFNLIKWIGANSFRTSHYPYADEILARADEEGIVIVAESPACTLVSFGDELLNNHKTAVAELVRRDKNHPSVVMWSIANEPQSSLQDADEYFNSITNYVRSLDSTRPLTAALATNLETDHVAQYLDVVSVNRYYAWYSDTGHLELIERQMVTEYTAWNNKFNKPVLTTEYGAGSLAGLHTLPAQVFTEDYQAALLEENFKAFDTLRQKHFFIGEMVWNFADFLTQQENFRPTGCMKGVFTRQRNPKMAAYILRSRYWRLSQQEY